MLIQIDIAPHDDNRLLKVRATSRAFTWRGEEPLDGRDGPRTVVFDVHDLPPGDYEIQGEITGMTGRSRGVVATQLRVRTGSGSRAGIKPDVNRRTRAGR